jgi:signal transduction histidine kinase
MYSRSSLFVLAIGFGVLIVLIAVLTFGAVRRADTIYRDMQTAQDSYSQMETLRRNMISDMYLADILVRDYLLDPSPQNAPRHLQELIVIRDSLQKRLDQLSVRPKGDSSRLSRLQAEVEGYWDSLDPIFQWTAKEKTERSWIFLARKVLPHRDAIVSLAREIARLNTENLARERQRLRSSQQALHTFLLQVMGVAVTIGIAVALLTTYRVRVLEKRIEETQDDLRRLSRRLVQAHETERRALSRELHDEVGQMMTALGIQLGNLDTLRTSDETAFHARLEDAKQLNTDAMRALRDLAMGLRPSMLDDLGLPAALEWQGREFSRHTGVPASVNVTGALDDLSDAHRTCIYRVVQEALTNCARHANAKNVAVSVRTARQTIVVVVRDDGIGFKPSASTRGGIGLLGIKERVQALHGKFRILSAPRKGTTIQVQLPAGMAA